MELITRYLTPLTAEWVDSSAPENIALAIELGIAAARIVIETRLKCLSAIEKATTMVTKLSENTHRGDIVVNDCVPQSEDKPADVLAPRVVLPSAVIGVVGEKLVLGALTSEFTDIKITSHDKMSGDMSVLVGGHKILAEVKNYSSGVPTREVKKFHRDLEATNSAAGLFVSLGGSQISTVTRSFELVYECCGSNIVPCAYVVASNVEQIIVAARMLIRAMALRAEPSYEKLSDAHNGLSALSCARVELQTGLGDIVSRIVGFGCGIASAEALLRESIASSREANYLEATTGPAVVLRLTRCGLISNYTPQLRMTLTEIIEIITGSRNGVIADTWRISENMVVDTITKISIKLLKSSAVVLFPRAMVSDAHILLGMHEFGEAFRVTKNIEPPADLKTKSWCQVVFGNQSTK